MVLSTISVFHQVRIVIGFSPVLFASHKSRACAAYSGSLNRVVLFGSMDLLTVTNGQRTD